jgi:hypothetical protein
MRALRIILIVTVILGGLFVIADRVAVGFAEDEAAARLKTNEGLASTPDVSIKGFPFLTQVVGGELDEVEVGIKNYEADTSGTTGSADNGTSAGPDKIRIDDLTAQMRGVAFSGDYSSAKAATATGSATISYAELLKAAKAEPVAVATGVTAQVVGLSDGGNGKIKVEVEATVLGTKLPEPDSLPNLGVQLAEDKVRLITDFQQKIDGLPGGIRIDKVEAAETGVDITVKGSDVQLVG